MFVGCGLEYFCLFCFGFLIWFIFYGLRFCFGFWIFVFVFVLFLFFFHLFRSFRSFNHFLITLFACSFIRLSVCSLVHITYPWNSPAHTSNSRSPSFGTRSFHNLKPSTWCAWCGVIYVKCGSFHNLTPSTLVWCGVHGVIDVKCVMCNWCNMIVVGNTFIPLPQTRNLVVHGVVCMVWSMWSVWCVQSTTSNHRPLCGVVCMVWSMWCVWCAIYVIWSSLGKRSFHYLKSSIVAGGAWCGRCDVCDVWLMWCDRL